MNAEEAKLIEEKLQGILKSIEDYGDQVEQFGKARDKLGDVLTANETLSLSLNELTISCNNLIKEIKEKVYDDAFAEIKKETESIQRIAEELKAGFEDVSNNLTKSTNDIQTSTQGLANSSKEAFDDLKNSLVQLKQSLNEVQNNLKNAFEISSSELSIKIDNHNQVSIQEYESLKQELEKQKSETKKEISTNRKLLIIGLVALGITLVVSVVGLFI